MACDAPSRKLGWEEDMVTRRPEKATATGLPGEREDEGTTLALPLHGMYAYDKH